MCKNTGQPGFDLTLKRPDKGQRLCNSFKTIRFLTQTDLTQIHMGRTQTRLTHMVHLEYSNGPNVLIYSHKFNSKKIEIHIINS